MRSGRYLGIGFATYTEQSAHGTKVFAAWGLPLVPGYDQAHVKLTPDGALEVKAGIHTIGQGLETTLAQIAHQMTGVPFADIRVTLGDTADHTVLHRCLRVARHRDGGRRGIACIGGRGRAHQGDRCASDAG